MISEQGSTKEVEFHPGRGRVSESFLDREGRER